MLRFGLLVVLVHRVCSASVVDDLNAAKWVLKTLERHEIDNAADELSPNLDPNYDDSDGLATEYESKGSCTYYYQCDGNTTIEEDGTTPIRFKNNEICQSYLEVYCVQGGHALGFGSESSNCNFQDIGKPCNTNLPKAANRLNEDECGWNNPNIGILKKTNKDRIYADFGEYPWMVAIIKTIDTYAWSFNDYVGGGSIIHPSVVVTAAHKVDLLDATEIKCRGGEWDTQSTNESLYQFQERNVNRILLHPNFFKTSLYYDAALLILKSPFKFGNAPHIGTACLSSDPAPIEGECFTMGWGRNPNESTTILKKTKLSVLSSNTCERQMKTTRLGPFFKLHKSLTCAGREDLDACQGDGGSALVCPIKTNGDHVRYAMVGIVAYGIGCGKLKVPGLYVKVSEIYPWINKVMTDEEYGTDTYRI